MLLNHKNHRISIIFNFRHKVNNKIGFDISIYNIGMASKLIIGNWKLYRIDTKTVDGFIDKLDTGGSDSIIGIAPTFPLLQKVADAIGRRKIELVAQDISLHEEGAHTGSISAKTLKDLGVSLCIVGHSEKRQEGETSKEVSEKAKILIKNDIIPIICIGEKERDSTPSFLNEIESQIIESTEGIKKKVIIAYEPVWAIGGDKKPPTAEDLLKISSYIRKVMKKNSISADILYGGSVNSENAKIFMNESNIDGLLIGSNSVHVNEFNEIIESL